MEALQEHCQEILDKFISPASVDEAKAAAAVGIPGVAPVSNQARANYPGFPSGPSPAPTSALKHNAENTPDRASMVSFSPDVAEHALHAQHRRASRFQGSRGSAAA